MLQSEREQPELRPNFKIALRRGYFSGIPPNIFKKNLLWES